MGAIPTAHPNVRQASQNETAGGQQLHDPLDSTAETDATILPFAECHLIRHDGCRTF